MRLGEILGKTEFCPCCCSSLAYTSIDPRLASDAFIARRSEQVSPPRERRYVARRSELPSEKI